MSRHRGAKRRRRYGLLGVISLLSPAYLLSVERWPTHAGPPDHYYAKVAEGLNVAATRVEKPADIVPAIKDAVAVTQSGAPFLLEIVAKQGYDFSRYPLAGL